MLRTTPTDQTFVAISGFRLNRVVSLTLLLRLFEYVEKILLEY